MNHNESHEPKLDIDVVSSITSFLNERRVMFQFDNDDPVQINSITENGEFIIRLGAGTINFDNNGKSFKLFVE